MAPGGDRGQKISPVDSGDQSQLVIRLLSKGQKTLGHGQDFRLAALFARLVPWPEVSFWSIWSKHGEHPGIQHKGGRTGKLGQAQRIGCFARADGTLNHVDLPHVDLSRLRHKQLRPEPLRDTQNKVRTRALPLAQYGIPARRIRATFRVGWVEME